MTVPGGAGRPTTLIRRPGRRRLVAVALLVALGMTGGTTAQAVEPQGADPGVGPEGGAPVVQPPAATPDPPPLGLSFEPNVGQADPDVDFLARSADYSAFLGPTAAILTLTPPAPDLEATGGQALADDAASPPTAMLAMELVGGDAGARVSAEERLAGTVNYLQGDDPDEWRTDVATYGRVSYDDVYPGIDLDYYGNEGHLQYDFVVAPEADPAAIALRFAGADFVSLDGGDLVLDTAAGEVRQPPPFVYQDDGGTRQQVAGAYALEGDLVSFDLGPYDTSRPLIIDPVLTYGTYLGGPAGDEGQGVTVDHLGNILVAGDTQASNPPFPGVGEGFEDQYQGGERDGFVAKISADGSTLLWATYLGGEGEERARSVAVDATGNVYSAGATFSTGASGLGGGPGFPTTPGALRETNTGNTGTSDAYVTKLSPDGAMIYSTLVGGSRTDGRTNVAVDGAGDLYVSGFTFSVDFPAPNGAQPRLADRADAFFVKLSPDGNGPADLLYGTYLGGRDNDTSRGVAVASDGDAVIAGWTMSDVVDFPVTDGAFKAPAAGNGDTFVARLDPSLSGAGSLVYSAVLGGSGGHDFPYLGNCLALDDEDNPHVTGFALSGDFPTTAGAVQETDPDPRTGTAQEDGRDAYAFKLSADGSALVYSTYLGSGGEDEGISASVGPSGDGYYTGFTDDRLAQPGDPPFPELDPLEPPPPSGRNAFVTRLGPDGRLVYSTQLGGSSTDTGYGIKAHPGPPGTEVATVMGFTSSTDFPTQSPVTIGHDGSRLMGNKDVFVAQISHEAGTAPAPRLAVAGTSVTEGDTGTTTATFTVTRSGDTTGSATVDYATGDGTATAPGDYTATSGTLTFAAGQTTGTIPVTVNGDTVDEPDETFTVTLSNPTGGAAITTATATGTIRDDDDPPAGAASLSITGTSVTEGNTGTTMATFTVTRSGDTTGSATVDYATGDGTATAPGDYTATSGTLTFAAGQTTGTIPVTVNGDTVDEPDETFTVTLSNPTGGATITTATATGTIGDDDDPPPGAGPTVSIADASVTEGDSGSVNATFTVSLSPASTGAVKVKFATAGDTATANLDYQTVTGGLNFAAGETEKTITVPVRGDTIDEPDETFFVRLSTVKGAAVGDAEAVGTIVDDDDGGDASGGTGPPTLSVAGASMAEGGPGSTTTATFTVTRSGDLTGTTTADWATSDGTATAPADYVSGSGQLSFAPGEATKTIGVVINGDSLTEGDEYFFVTLTNLVGAETSRSGRYAHGMITDDDDGEAPPPDDAGTGPATLSIADVSVSEGNAGTVVANFVVTRSGDASATVTVRFRTAGGTATSGSDYQSVMGTLTFDPGVATQTIAVTVNGDTLAEANETFLVELGKVQGATLARTTATGTILDDD